MLTYTGPVNSVSFTPEDVQKNLHWDLIKYLLDYNQRQDQYFNDVHITSDGFCVIVEWAAMLYAEANQMGFCYIDDSHCLMKCVALPDNSCEYCFDSDADEVLKNWLAEHPEYKQNENCK